MAFEDYVTIRCFACGGPYHPATGHLGREFMVPYCGTCTCHFFAWVKSQMRRKWGKMDFYVEAAKKQEEPACPGT